MSGSSSLSVQNVLDRILLKEQPNETTEPFLPSSTWQGTRPGYFFGTGDQGTGYYLDTKKSGNETPNQKKRSVQINETKNETRVYTPTSNNASTRLSSSTLLEQAEQRASKSTVVELTPRGIQIAANTLEKLVQKNAMQRAEHAEDAQYYMESELALHDHLQALTAVAANVELYPYVLEETSLLDTLTQLLGHDNDDIAAIVVSLYWEWLDPTLLKGDPDLAPIFQSLASRVLTEAWETIVANFARFQNDEDNDQQQDQSLTMSNDPTLNGIDNALSLMENLLDLDLMIPDGISGNNLSAAAYMVQETKIVSWLLEQVDTQQQPPNVEFQARCMELVAFVAQRDDVHTILTDWSQLSKFSNQDSTTSNNNNNSEPPQKKTKQQQDDKEALLDGIECMLQTIGKFRKIQPVDDNEIGLLENTCLALSSCITFSTNNLIAFLQGQGVELVVRCLKERVHSGATCLKLLDFVTSRSSPGGDDNDNALKPKDQVDKDYAQQGCERIITAGGLKYLFPLFVQTRIPQPAPSYTTTTKAKREWLATIETQTIRILYSLSRYLQDDSPEDGKARFLSKFVQDEEKCDRLVELLLYYDEKARRAEYNFYRSDVEEIVEDEETIQLAALDAKLKGGGDLFHRLGALAAFVSVHSKRCHERILSQLQLQQSGISLVKMALEEFIDLLEVNSPQRVQLEAYLTKL